VSRKKKGLKFMKLGRILFIVFAIAFLGISFCYLHGVAATDKIAPAKVAIVDVTKVLKNSKKHKQWQEKMTQDEEQMKAEFQKNQKELEALKANLDLLKIGSKDYIDTMKDFLDKKSLLDAKDKFYQEKVNIEMQQWMEGLYTQMLDVTAKIAQKKGVDIVLAQEPLDFPSSSLQAFMTTLHTGKVLYYNTQIDITESVLAALDETP